MLPKALKSCSKSNKSPNLVTLLKIFQIAECTDAKIRGLLGSLPAVFMAFGISYVYLLGAFMPWHILSYLCTAVPLLTFIGILFSPESPAWLVANGKLKEADRASNWLQGIETPIVKYLIFIIQHCHPFVYFFVLFK